MRNRSGPLNPDPKSLTLDQLDSEIARISLRLQLAETAYLKKSFTSRLRFLEKCKRELTDD